MTTPLCQLQHMLEPFEALLENGTEDIAVNRPHEAWAYRKGLWQPHEMPTLDFETLIDMTILAAAVTNQKVSKRMPLLFGDIPTPNGIKLRLMAFLPPAVEHGQVSWTLRQPDERIHRVNKIKERYKTDGWNQWEQRKDDRDHSVALALYDAADIEGFVSHIVKDRYNILLCGGTGSSKTSMSVTCISEIPHNERIITIENTREYNLEQRNRVHLLYSQGGQGLSTATQDSLQVGSLRSRPDRVLVQELLDADAADTYVTQVISGHPGSITTIHGTDPSDAFKKLYGLVAGKGNPMILQTLCSAIDVIMPFKSKDGVFSIGKTFFAPAAARHGETAADLLKEIA